MATFYELKRDYGWKHAFKEAWEALKWYWPNLIGWIKVLIW